MTKAREADGYPYRNQFAALPGLNLRSVDKLENGEPGVGQSILFAAARHLSNWTEDTPREILEGGDPPPVASPSSPEESPILESGPVIPPGELPDYSNLSPDERRRIIRRSIDQLPFALDVSQSAYEAVRESLIRLIVKYEPRDGEQ